MSFKNFRNIRITCSIIALLFYILMLICCIWLKIYSVFFVFLFLLIYLIFRYGLIRKIYMKYGIKKQGYVSYYNDFSCEYGPRSHLAKPKPEVDIIINDAEGEKRIISRNLFNSEFLRKIDNSKFLELSSSNKKIYVDVYFFDDKYYVDFDSFIIE